MSLRKIVGTVTVSALLGLATPYTAMAEDKAAMAKQSIEQAEQSLADAKAAGSVWQLIDKATGSSSESLDKLLGAAKAKQDAGEFDEAIRIAKRVADAAMLGVEQAQSQKGKVKPFYN